MAVKKTKSRNPGLTVVHRGKGRVYKVRYRDPAGSTRSKTFATEDEAVAFRDGVRQEVRAGTWVPPENGRVPWSTVAEGWLGRKARKRKPDTVNEYRRILRTWLAPWADRPVNALTRDDVTALLDAMTDGGRSAQTQYNVFNVASAVFDYALRERRIRENPCRMIREDLPGRTHGNAPRLLTADEVAQLAAELPPPYDLCVTFTAWSGLRFGEVAGLRVKGVDPLRSTVRVEEAVSERNGVLTVGTPKTQTSRRTVPIPPALARLVTAQVAARNLGPEDFLFGTGDKPLRRNFYARQFLPAVLRAELGHVRYHDLRHTFAALMDQRGEPLHHVSKWMGHSSAAFTSDVYMRGLGLFQDDDPQRQARADAQFLAAQPRTNVSAFPTA